MLVRFCGMVWVLFRVFFLLNPFAPQYQETTIKVGFGTLRRGGGPAGVGRGEANISLTLTSTLLRDKTV